MKFFRFRKKRIFSDLAIDIYERQMSLMEKLARAKTELGTRYACHPANDQKPVSHSYPAARAGRSGVPASQLAERGTLTCVGQGTEPPTVRAGEPSPPPISVEYGPPPTAGNVLRFPTVDFGQRITAIRKLIRHAESLKW